MVLQEAVVSGRPCRLWSIFLKEIERTRRTFQQMRSRYGARYPPRKTARLGRWNCSMTGRLFLLGLLVTLGSGCTVSVSTEPEQQFTAKAGTPEQAAVATKAARAIVEAIDRLEYERVWDQSSPIFKRLSSRMVFIKMLEYTRGRLGKPDPGRTGGVGFSERVDAKLPKGQYAVVIVHSTYGGKPLEEKLVMSMEEGQWKLVGYFIQSRVEVGAQDRRPP